MSQLTLPLGKTTPAPRRLETTARASEHSSTARGTAVAVRPPRVPKTSHSPSGASTPSHAADWDAAVEIACARLGIEPQEPPSSRFEARIRPGECIDCGDPMPVMTNSLDQLCEWCRRARMGTSPLACDPVVGPVQDGTASLYDHDQDWREERDR